MYFIDKKIIFIDDFCYLYTIDPIEDHSSQTD
jgi:hypothetical protein